MNEGMKLYYDYTISPLGKLYYKTLFKQLESIDNKKILDFGSGFGFAADFLAKNNEVTAIEPDASIIEYAINTNDYTQVHGNLDDVTQMPDEGFDVVMCHLVLEFVDNPSKIIKELVRVLKRGGILSVVKHNVNGRIIQAVVQDFDLNDANNLLCGGYSFSSAFGDIKYYHNEELKAMTDCELETIEIFGIRALASLHGATVQNSEHWTEKMFDIEYKLLEHDDFIKTAYFNHILLQKRR